MEYFVGVNMDTQLIEQNRALTTIKHEDELPKHITFSQYKTLRNHPGIESTKDRMLITLLWETAGRVSDVLGLRWKNFEGLNGNEPNLRFIIQKTQKPINIPISAELASELRSLKQEANPKSDDEYLFIGKSKLKHETRQNVDKKMKRWGKLIGMDGLHAHMFRHGLIIYLFLVQGLHYKLIAARTGHTNPMMIINTYSVVTNQMQREALKNIPMR